jgi:flagellar protein FlbD
MIPVTRLDGTPMIVNCEQIAWIEYVPDTVISLMNGEKLIVSEPPETIVERVHDFKRAVWGGARRAGHVVGGLTLATDAGGER